jgi:decaprenyl-phosphate phosphoribosyltransferase
MEYTAWLQSMVLPLLRAARPHQWVKNSFVAAPLVFAQRMDDVTAVTRTVIAIACFCLLSSAVYLLNDLVDVEKDRAHPVKRSRPIAAGTLSVGAARAAAIIAALTGLGVGGWLSPMLAAVGAGYLGLNVAYSFWLKKIAFVDVACIALGFLLRVLGGAYAIPVAPSWWLLSCTVLLAAFLGFGKRAHELRVAGQRSTVQRAVLGSYHPGVLRALLIGLAVATTVVYAAYTLSPHAVASFGTRGLVLTVPFVGFGVFRFIRITGGKSDAESPTDSMLRDGLFLFNILAYALSIVLVIYYL